MYYGTALKTFNNDLSALTDGENMFGESALEEFNGDLSSLTSAVGMFYFTKIKTFTRDMSALTNGSVMFNHTYLNVFKGDLSSLDMAEGMFGLCSLTDESVMYIADSIKEWGVYGADGSLTGTTDNATHNITIDVANTTSEDVAEYLMEIAQKGWTVATNHTSFTAASVDEDGKPSAIFAIARPSTEEKATYVDGEGKFYTIETAVSVIGIGQSEWSIFASIEDAIAEWELTPVTK
jgi:hypothetical protein